MDKKILFCFVFLLVIPLLTLVRADFTIESQLDTNTVCPSNTIIINEIITSTTDSSYSVSLSGSASSFTTAVPSGFFLNSGKKQTVFLYITPSSRITPGSYSLTFQVTSQGVSKTVSHSVIVENCHATSVVIEPVTQKTCTCEEKSFQLTIKNNGKYLESYNLEASGPLSSYTTFSIKTFSLSPGQSINVNAYVKAPCNIAGNYDLTFKVNAESKYAQTEVSSKLELVPCYDYTFSVEKNFYETCENQKVTIPVTLKNIGTQENTYSIKLTAPAWVSADQKSLKISPGQEKIFNLIVQPPLQTAGNSTITLDFLSEKGSISQKLNLDLNVGSCYGSTLSLERKEDTICNGMSNAYSITIKNTGKFSNDFLLVLEAPAWVTLNKNQFTLNPNEEGSALLTASPSNDVPPATYTISVKSLDSNKLEVKDSLSLTTVSQEQCYQPSVVLENNQITVPQETPATSLFTIENKGLLPADYLVELSGTAASFCLINPSTISLESGKAQTLYLYIFPPTDTQPGNYTLTLTARLKDSAISSRKELIIIVTGEVSNQTGPIINITNQTGTEKPVVQKKTFWQAITGFFASIFGPNKQTNKTEETNETIVSLKNNPPVLKEDIPDIEINSGDEYIIDLSKYFEDKDGDTLEFITLKPEDMNILIKGNKITLVAPKSLEGEREITFYATDGQVMISSNVVPITITASKEKATTPAEFDNKTNKSDDKITGQTTKSTNFFAQYKSYLILAIVVAIVIILIMSGLGKKILQFFEEEPEKKKK